MNTATEVNDNLSQLKSVQWVALQTSLLALAVVLYYWPTFPVVAGLVAGSIVGIFNFRFLTRVILKLTSPDDEESSSTKQWGFFFFLKMMALIFIAGFLILVVHVEPMAFVAGFSTIIVGILYQSLKTFI